MGKKMKREWLKKLLAFTLALAVGVTFIPLFGNNVSAEGEGGEVPDVVVGADGEGIDVVIDGEEAAPAEGEENVIDITPSEYPVAEDVVDATTPNQAAAEPGDVAEDPALKGKLFAFRQNYCRKLHI